MEPAETAAGEENQKLVPGRSVRLSGEIARVGAPGSQQSGPPQIKLVRSGNAVQGVEITCTCGKHIRLRCVQGPVAAT